MGYSKYNKGDFNRDVSAASAFTLIELLTALAIFSVIAISIYTSFSAGIFSWRRLSDVSDNYQQAAAALDVMSDEIASYIPSGKVKFEGTKDKVAFLSKIKNNSSFSFSKTSFFFDRNTNSIMSVEDDLNAKPVISVLAGGVKGLEFMYYCRKPASTSEYEWVESYSGLDKTTCSAVSISVKTAGVLKKIVLLNVEVNGGIQA